MLPSFLTPAQVRAAFDALEAEDLAALRAGVIAYADRQHAAAKRVGDLGRQAFWSAVAWRVRGGEGLEAAMSAESDSREPRIRVEVHGGLRAFWEVA